MHISRRKFLQYCSLSAAAIGLDVFKLGLLEKALANPTAPSVIWLHGSSCTGCSVSLLNRISNSGPANIAAVLTDAVNLVYHPTIMAATGDSAVAEMIRVRDAGGFVLVVEGAVPTAFGGAPCIAYSYNGREVTFQEAVQDCVAKAAFVVCVGTCASFGGIPASGSNPTGATSVHNLTGRTTVNISGCPANPDWVIWAIVQILTSTPIDLDADGRPTALYSKDLSGASSASLIHDKCPRNIYVNPGAVPAASSFANCDGACLLDLGCRGPYTKSRCDGCWNTLATDPLSPPSERWRKWCVGVNSPCHGCVEKTFPGPKSFYVPYNPNT